MYFTLSIVSSSFTLPVQKKLLSIQAMNLTLNRNATCNVNAICDVNGICFQISGSPSSGCN